MTETLTILFLILVITFILGLLFGWHLIEKEQVFTQSSLQILVGILVTIVWTISIAAEIFIPTYTVSVLIHGIMGAVVGYLFSDDGITFNIGGD